MKKVYNSKEIEEKWCKYWIENKTFSAKLDGNRKPFTMFIPPANITGSLHMGHALNVTLQDIIIRFKKLKGYNTLWVPGTDHGGIATQNVVEKLLKKEGRTKYDLGRDKFLEKMQQWKTETGSAILDQLKKLGCGLDWDRLAFTMDESRSKAVKKAFIKLFNKGLIYRGKRLVNWCSRCATALSDIEVEYEDERSNLWYIKYPLRDCGEYIIVATTRPETILGDIAVAVNPDDNRYAKFIGKTVKLPLVDREIKIISDYVVDKSFGTGAVKITPAHDAVDNEIGKRSNLETIEVIDTSGRMINVLSKYLGLSVEEARKEVVKDLKASGFLVKTEDYVHSVGKCYRCSAKIESLMSEQWFLNVKKMSEKAVEAVNDGRMSFYPQSWKKPYVLWLENLKDWCLSRQIWWGHKIPVYYCVDEKGKRTNCSPVASLDRPAVCSCCKGRKFIQDEDVLDTWFSSALWPMSIFDWGEDENNEDLRYFYPASVLATGHEIIYLWVARMVQFGLEFMKDVPYSNVFIHGIVRDKNGKKMSKSLGNVVNPGDIMDKYGTDALRFALAQVAAPGRDMQISEESFLAARNFANKIWNASRFIIINSQDISELDKNIQTFELADEWIIAEFAATASKVKAGYESYNIDSAAREIYDFFWTKYCDWYVELSKIRIMSADLNVKKRVLSILVYVLKSTLQLVSPVMPFIAEEIWRILNKGEKYIGIISESSFAEVKEGNSGSIEKMKVLQDIIVKIRILRSEMNISPAVWIEALFNVLDERKEKVAKENESYIKQLARISSIRFVRNITRTKNSALIVAGGFEIFLLLEGLIDIDKEKARLAKEIALAKQEVGRTTLKLQNKYFIKRAAESEIEKIKLRLNEANLKIEKTKESLKFLG
ncbi:valine--tRNA ligase [Endomicrobiia bacterium]|uniref:valine--tRNA ligase n=1 Tax=Endomicrobium trichonymphae TaxID=1408204 RepID=UPI0008649B75|nr:valine--tRNA ligase [Candidatus Endomicrobium trichonymphae]GHT06752.1 valine--tRNA ligase [Endomicrobiia bacterium]BAV59102.1 valyl-tRNA synthetase [Candidatus Endomicrobium trichonymphae]GHT14173.1 valine--tRNA ligase [Endomicrobiia bacterium]GHT16169.1 valine--tRNA ligase [Endomicrobiia bacterium]GHT20255.1 valine--tRNA ligase [Endomicrobiia bacterium]